MDSDKQIVPVTARIIPFTKPKDTIPVCSFCKKPNDKRIHGNGSAAICYSCVAQCTTRLTEDV